MAAIKWPADGKFLGDWKAGEKLAQDGRGMTWSDKAGSPAGGNWYNCHQLSPKELSYGTIGPSLYHYGKSRGNSAEVQKYTFGKIFNSKAYNLCTNMPRFGHQGILSESQIMVDACKLLGVDMMSAHWAFTLGADRVKQIVEGDLADRIEFLAQNVKTADFGDPVFKPYALREMNGVRVAVIGQAFPYTPIVNPRHLIPDWTFGVQDEVAQKVVTRARGEGAQVVVVLSHNGMDVDLKMASRVSGIDAVLGGHTHDGVPAPSMVRNADGRTLLMNSGSNGKFLSVLDLDVRNGKIQNFRSKLLPADKEMAAHIDKVRAPYAAKLGEKLAVSEGLLYRRGNFNGSWDQLILDALLDVKGAQIAFSPGFRWGTSILSGQTITMEHLMDQTAITYPHSTLSDMTGAAIKTVLEDVADNLFNPDPYLRQGGDMVRVGAMTYACDPAAKIGRRILDMRLGDKPIDPGRIYKVAGWAPVAEGASGEPIWDVVAKWLRDKKTVTPRQLNLPKLRGVGGNPGIG